MELTTEHVQFVESYRQKEATRRAKNKAYRSSEGGKATLRDAARRWRAANPDKIKARSIKKAAKRKADRALFLQLTGGQNAN